MKIDDVIARFEARNLKKLIEEAEARRRSRIIAFTRVDLMRAVLATAAYRAAKTLGISPEKCRAALVPDAERRRMVPSIEIADDVEVDQAVAKRTFSTEFQQVSSEWRFDLTFADADARYSSEIASQISRKETLAEFAQRIVEVSR